MPDETLANRIRAVAEQEPDKLTNEQIRECARIMLPVLSRPRKPLQAPQHV